MDRTLRRSLDAIARDRTSGAAELAIRAVKALQAWLRRRKSPTQTESLEVARALVTAQPSMAPLLRLANEVALAAELDWKSRHRSLKAFHEKLVEAPNRIAGHFKRTASKRRTRLRVVTYSYSSTVIRALIHARRHIESVTCSESRPGLEGRETARALARAGIWVQFTTDAELFAGVLDWHHVVVGADAILADAFLNKVGTEVLDRQALRIRARTWVLADTTKLWPETSVTHLLRRISNRVSERPRDIWPGAPRGVDAGVTQFQMFQLTGFHRKLRFLTERGWMTPRQVRAALRKIRIAQTLRRLRD